MSEDKNKLNAIKNLTAMAYHLERASRQVEWIDHEILVESVRSIVIAKEIKALSKEVDKEIEGMMKSEGCVPHE